MDQNKSKSKCPQPASHPAPNKIRPKISRQRFRYCIYGCTGNPQLYSLPKDTEISKLWEAFIFADQPPQPKVIICARHFSDDSFLNKGQYDTGFAKQLLLKHGSVPSIRGVQGAPEPRAAPSASVCKHEPAERVSVSTRKARSVTSIGTQVTGMILRGQRSIATQLAFRTLQQHVRSKATQSTVSSASKTTETDCHPSSTPLKESVAVSGVRPAKMPRLEFQKDEGEETAGDSLSQRHQTLASTYQSGESLTDTSQMSEAESAVHPQPKYIVSEQCLKELFETCPLCRRKCVLQQRKMDTYMAFHQRCHHCQYTRIWQSQ